MKRFPHSGLPGLYARIMWNRLAEGIIRYRLPLSILIALITIFMGYHAAKVEMSYEFARTVPPDDPDMLYHDQFKAQFGEDANLIAVGLKDSGIYELQNFLAFRELTREIKKSTALQKYSRFRY